MAPRAAFYNPDEVAIYFLGQLLQGFAEDEMISVESPPAFDDVVGVDGEVTRSKTNNRTATVKIKLMQSSLSNAPLSAALNSDINAPNGAGVGAFQMADLSSGGTVVDGAQAWIVGFPDATMARKAGPREWTIRIAVSHRIEAGN